MLSTEQNGASGRKNTLQTYGESSYTLTWFVKNSAQRLLKRVLWDSEKTIVTLENLICTDTSGSGERHKES